MEFKQNFWWDSLSEQEREVLINALYDLEDLSLIGVFYDKENDKYYKI